MKRSADERHWMPALSRTARNAVTLAILCPLLAGVLLVGQAWLLSGELDRAMIQQVEAVNGFFAHDMPAMIAVLLPLAFAVVVMPIAPIVGLIFLFTAPLIPVFMALVGWGAESASRQQMQAFLSDLAGMARGRTVILVTHARPKPGMVQRVIAPFAEDVQAA